MNISNTRFVPVYFFILFFCSSFVFSQSLPNGEYTIQQESNFRYLDAYTKNKNDQSLMTRPKENDNTQIWILNHIGNNVYTIEQKSSGLFVDAYTKNKKDFGVMTRPAENNETQKWIITPLTNNKYTVRQKSTGRYLDAYTKKKEDYKLMTRPQERDNTQQWIFNLIKSYEQKPKAVAASTSNKRTPAKPASGAAATAPKNITKNQPSPPSNNMSYRNFDYKEARNPSPFDNGIRKNADLPFESGIVYFYKIMESTKAEYVAEGSDGNILRWSDSGKDDQLWLIYPDNAKDGSKKYRIQNKGSQQYMAVTGNGNMHRWTKVANDPGQLFEFKRAGRGTFFIQEGTKNERVAVGSNGNILRWEAHSGKEQQFIPVPYPPATIGLHPQNMKIKPDQPAFMPGKIPMPPRIKDFSQPQNGPAYFISEAVLPGTHVNDPLYDNKITQINRNNSPYYYLVREQYYKPVQRILEANSNITKVEEDALVFTEEQINSVTETLGWALEASAGVTAGVGVPGAEANASAGLSAGLSHSTETREENRSKTESSHMERLTINFTSPPQRLNVVVWYLMDRFTLYNYRGRPVPGKQWEVENNKFVETFPYTPWDGASVTTR